MVKKYIKLCLGIALMCSLNLCVTSCKDDDDKSAPAQPKSRVQVTTVFAPGQLGDMGYADRVMKGVGALRKADASDVEVGIIASDDVKTARKMLADWTKSETSAIDGATYNRRLLVLTESYMVDWLAENKSNLKSTDEVLLLKVNEDDVQAAAQKLGLGDRVYGLNISAASAVERFNKMRLQYCEWNALKPDSVPIEMMRLYDQGVVNYRDGISEKLHTLFPKFQDSDIFTIIDQPGEQYSNRYEVTAFEAAYHVCGICYAVAIQRADSLPSERAYKTFVISDLGSANNGADLFLVSTNQRIGVIMLMLDAESNTDMVRFAVIRHFDRALANWAQSWLQQSAASMPRMTMYGDGDGYCTDDIDADLLRGI